MKVRAAVTIRRSREEVASAWSSTGAAPFVENAQVTYAPAPGDRGTEVRVATQKRVFGGAVGQKVAAAVGSDPQRQLDDALRRFKQILETGQVVRSDGSPEGTDAKRQRSQQPAQPVESASAVSSTGPTEDN